MTQHIEAGRQGEELAATFLEQRDYKIIQRNWRYSHYEIDIIAMKDGLPHFVEVKLRTSSDIIFPENSVTRKKKTSLARAVDEFIFQHPEYKDFRVDILSIIALPGSRPQFFFIEDIHLGTRGLNSSQL